MGIRAPTGIEAILIEAGFVLRVGVVMAFLGIVCFFLYQRRKGKKSTKGLYLLLIILAVLTLLIVKDVMVNWEIYYCDYFADPGDVGLSCPIN